MGEYYCLGLLRNRIVPKYAFSRQNSNLGIIFQTRNPQGGATAPTALPCLWALCKK